LCWSPLVGRALVSEPKIQHQTQQSTSNKRKKAQRVVATRAAKAEEEIQSIARSQVKRRWSVL